MRQVRHVGVLVDDMNVKRVNALINGYVVSQAIYCAVRLEVADLLAAGPKSSEELAALAGCSPLHLHRLICALAEVGVFRFSNRLVTNTPMSELLRRDVEHSVRSHALFSGMEMYHVFGGLHDNVITGTAAWQVVKRETIWSYLSRNAESGALFDATMRSHQARDLVEMAIAVDLKPHETVVDVGGGDGALLEQLLRQQPNADAILVDRPDVVRRAESRRRADTDIARYHFYGSDIFAEIPQGAAVYLLKHVLHDWDDTDCLRLLTVCRAAMTRSSRLIIIESPLGSVQLHHGWRDLGMMVLGGRERTFDEYEYLVRSSGMKVVSRSQASWGDMIRVALAP